MDKKTWSNILFILAIVIGLSLIGGVFFMFQSQNQYALYEDEGQGFSIKYPAEWEVKTDDESGAAVIFLSPLENDLDFFKESINIVVQDISANPMSLGKYTETAIFQMRAVFKQYLNVVESTGTKLSGLPAHRFTFTGTGDGAQLKYMSTWTIKGYTAYQVTYVALNSKFDQYLDKAQAMIKSFKIK
jgi:hypothetical protein